MVFVFSSVYVINYICRVAYVEPTLYPRDEVNLIAMDRLFDVLLDLVCQYLTEDFHINVHHGYWSEIFFLVVSLPSFAIRIMLVS